MRVNRTIFGGASIAVGCCLLTGVNWAARIAPDMSVGHREGTRATGHLRLLTRIGRASRDAVMLMGPGAHVSILSGTISSSVMALQFDRHRPAPNQCRPPELDKWQHCYVGCEIADKCPVGAVLASVLAVLKEIRDKVTGGRFSVRDMLATFKGIWDRPMWGTCEAFCCGEFG